jgi:hypothetical protein
LPNIVGQSERRIFSEKERSDLIDHQAAGLAREQFKQRADRF